MSASSVCVLSPPLFHPFVSRHLGCVANTNTETCSFNELSLKQNKRIVLVGWGSRVSGSEGVSLDGELQSGFHRRDSVEFQAGGEHAVL